MNPFQLFKEGGEPVNIWACGGCGKLYGGTSGMGGKPMAEACCVPPTCEDCGASCRPHWRVCDGCHKLREVARKSQQLADAVKVEGWDGWVYWDGQGTNDGYFSSLGELLEWHEEQVEDGEEVPSLPEFVFCCKTHPFRGLDAYDLADQVTGDSFEDARDQVRGLEALQVACKAFNEANASLVSYTPDWTRVVRTSPALTEVAA